MAMAAEHMNAKVSPFLAMLTELHHLLGRGELVPAQQHDLLLGQVGQVPDA